MPKDKLKKVDISLKIAQIRIVSIMMVSSKTSLKKYKYGFVRCNVQIVISVKN